MIRFSVDWVSFEGGGDVPTPYEPEPAIVGSTIRYESGVMGFHVGNHGREVDFPLMCLVARVAFRQDFIAAQPSIKKGS